MEEGEEEGEGLEVRASLSGEAGGLRQRLRAAEERCREAEESSRALQVGGEFLHSGLCHCRVMLYSLVPRLSSGFSSLSLCLC